MTARHEKRRNSETGETWEVWTVDFRFQYPDGRRRRIRKDSPVNTRRGAEEYERQLRSELLAGTFEQEQKQAPSFAEYVKDFMSTYAKNNNKESEVHTKQVLLDLHLVPFFGEHPIDQIGSKLIEKYKAERRKTLEKKTVNNHLAVLSKVLNNAVEEGDLAVSPPIKFFKAPPPEFDFLSFEEAPRLVAAADPGLWRTMITVALNTGLRQGELLALRWSDVDLVAGRLLVRRNDWKGNYDTPKGGRSREIPLNAEALRVLKAQRHLRGELVFCRDDGKRLTYQQLFKALLRIAKRANLGRIEGSWHTLRHTFASHLVMRGVPLKAVQELLGHSTIQMTMRYAHLSPAVKRDAVAVLDGQWMVNGPEGSSNYAH